jgi:hypothetical protein
VQFSHCSKKGSDFTQSDFDVTVFLGIFVTVFCALRNDCDVCPFCFNSPLWTKSGMLFPHGWILPSVQGQPLTIGPIRSFFCDRDFCNKTFRFSKAFIINDSPGVMMMIKTLWTLDGVFASAIWSSISSKHGFITAPELGPLTSLSTVTRLRNFRKMTVIVLYSLLPYITHVYVAGDGGGPDLVI